MSSVPKAKIILRIIKTILFLENPHTIKELGKEIGLSKFSARIYLRTFKEVGLEIMSRQRISPKTGENPMEYWIDCNRVVVLETVKMIARLKEM